MAAVAPASFHSELQAEDYSPRTRLARVEIEKNNRKSVMANASPQLKEQLAPEDTPVESEADDLPEAPQAEAQTNGTTAYTPSGDEKDGDDGEESEHIDPTERSTGKEDKVKAHESNEASGPDEDNEVLDDEEGSEDEASNAESAAIEDWQDASASIAAGSVADASTRNHCVYVVSSKFVVKCLQFPRYCGRGEDDDPAGEDEQEYLACAVCGDNGKTIPAITFVKFEKILTQGSPSTVCQR